MLSKAFSQCEEEKLQLLDRRIAGVGDVCHRRQVVDVVMVSERVGEVPQVPEFHPSTTGEQAQDTPVEHDGLVARETLVPESGELCDGRYPKSANPVQMGVVVRPDHTLCAGGGRYLGQILEPAFVDVSTATGRKAPK